MLLVASTVAFAWYMLVILMSKINTLVHRNTKVEYKVIPLGVCSLVVLSRRCLMGVPLASE